MKHNELERAKCRIKDSLQAIEEIEEFENDDNALHFVNTLEKNISIAREELYGLSYGYGYRRGFMSLASGIGDIVAGLMFIVTKAFKDTVNLSKRVLEMYKNV